MKRYITHTLLLIIMAFTTSCQINQNHRSMALPKEAGVIDVTGSPFYADKSGKTDCSEALQQAFEYASKRTKGVFTDDERAVQIIYFPKGTYKISKPLRLITKEVEKARAAMQIPLKSYISGHIIIYGESREDTKIVLADNSPLFGDKPTPVISFFNQNFCNTAYFNGMRNLTIEIGEGNPGAVAVKYVSNNNGLIKNVDIISKEREVVPHTGLDLPVRGGGLGLITNLRVIGFKRGISIAGDYPGFSFENIYLEGQSDAAIYNNGKNIVIHNFESKNSVPALKAVGEAAITTILNGNFHGGAIENSAVENEGHILLRDIKADGYKNIIDKSEGISYLDEYSSNQVRLFSDAPTTTLDLPIKQTPSYQQPLADEWTIFDAEAQIDDTEALQELIDSGAEYIFVSSVNQKLRLTNTIYLRGNLKVLNGGWCNMDIENISGEVGRPLFHIQDGKHDLMVVEAFSSGQERYSFTTFFNERNKTLVLSDMFMGYGDVSYRNSGTGDLFIENVVTGGGDYPELAEHTTSGWLFKRQNVWFRNLNPEEWVPDIEVGEGATLFGMGAKFGELYGTHIKVTDGGKAEMYGIMCNVNLTVHHKFGLETHAPSMTGMSIEVENGDLSIGAMHDGKHDDPDPIFIREIQGADTLVLNHSEAPLRGRTGNSIATPLYRSYYKPAK